MNLDEKAGSVISRGVPACGGDEMYTSLSKSNMHLAMRAAAGLPTVSFWALLVAIVPLAGGRIVPEDLWDLIGVKLINVPGSTKGEEFDGVYALDIVSETMPEYGFEVVENHSRSNPHESWSFNLIQEKIEQNPGKDVWVLPVDEIVCLAMGADDYMDMVSLTRAIFIGSEQELRTALAAWITGWRTF
jgi:hypothetical protein